MRYSRLVLYLSFLAERDTTVTRDVAWMRDPNEGRDLEGMQDWRAGVVKETCSTVRFPIRRTRLAERCDHIEGEIDFLSATNLTKWSVKPVPFFRH